MLFKPSSLKRPKRLVLGVRLEDIFAVGLVKSTPRKTTLCHFESGTIDRFFSVALGKGCCRVHRPHSKNKLARSYQVELLSYLICKRKFVYLLISLPIKQYFLTWLLLFSFYFRPLADKSLVGTMVTVSLTFALTLTAANVIRVLLEFTVNDEVTNENVLLPLSGKFKAIKN